jgi:hypothetical protein
MASKQTPAGHVLLDSSLMPPTPLMVQMILLIATTELAGAGTVISLNHVTTMLTRPSA